MKNIIIVSLVLVLIGGAIWFLLTRTSEEPILPEEEITSFEECVVAGYSILESYPRQCKTPDGKTFTEEIQLEDETADWQVYRNEEYGYELKYPKNWSFREFSKKFAGFSPSGKESQAGIGYEHPGEITITVYPTLGDFPNNEEELGFDDWIDQEISTGRFKNKKEVIVGKGNYTGLEVQDLGIVNFRTILLTLDSALYLITTNEDSFEMLSFDQMLSTFRFLE